MAKVNTESAYHLVPWLHLGLNPAQNLWEGSIFVDAMLFGLRSAPKIFNAVVYAIQWQFEQTGVCS